MAVKAEFILQGYAYALEQCGVLLRDGCRLYKDGSHASAIVLTRFAQEALGQAYILLDLWRRASGGESFTTEQLRDACKDHGAKQRAGMASLNISTDKDTGVGKVLTARMANPPGSPERQKADAALEQIDKSMRRRTPADRHDDRITALYVDPTSETTWNRPTVTVSASDAFEALRVARNDYSIRIDQWYLAPGSSSSEVLKQSHPDLFSALDQWRDRPKLLPAPDVGLPPPKTAAA
jgi:AbiV family abortive infection protein